MLVKFIGMCVVVGGQGRIGHLFALLVTFECVPDPLSNTQLLFTRCFRGYIKPGRIISHCLITPIVPLGA